MQVTTLGTGPIKAAVVGGIHGDEPCGPTAIQRFLAEGASVETGSVKFIIANERAVEHSTRYIETDLNRSFPGERGSSVHEENLAARLVTETEGIPTLGLHSTRSSAEPFAIYTRDDAYMVKYAPQLPVDHLVDAKALQQGRFINQPQTIEVECGRQGTPQAAENAYTLIQAFLQSHGLLAGTPTTGIPNVYRLTGTIQKDPTKSYTVCVDNFERVPTGTVVARAEDGSEHVAKDSFVPILVSADGYEEILGHTADACGVARYATPGPQQAPLEASGDDC